MASKLLLCLGLFSLSCLFQVVESGGKIEIQMIRFQSGCSDNLGFSQCDTFFIFCIDIQRHPNPHQCHYKRKQTGHYHDRSSMDFGSDIKGVDNPLVASATSFPTRGASDVMFILEARDDEVSGSQHIVTMSKNLAHTPAPRSSEAKWQSVDKRSGSHHMWLKYRFYCDAHYYTTKCNVYCKARDDDEGHYTCIEGTGKKKCIRGWTGENCDVDINECGLGPCYHNATCTNLPGWYECSCPQGYTGQNCDLIDSLCHSAPCKNGGTCNGTMQDYGCTCPFEWKGDNCETQVDFCESSPCLNNATCYATLGNYTCACTRGWTGYHCTTEVNACDGAPCQNNGNCTKRPEGEYKCTCPGEFEGSDCQTLKDPCDPNPCLNSGTCAQLTPDAHSCTCVFGWKGSNCSDFINVSSQQEQEEGSGDGDDETVTWLPILLAILSAIVIAICIIILLYLRRRRRQKKAAAQAACQESGGDVVHVAGTENLAFRNALYDHTNRANSALEAQGSRPPLPVPTPPCTACDDAFNFTKAKMVEESEEAGAVGGCNPYQDIDGYETPAKCVDMNGAAGVKVDSNPMARSAMLDTRTLAGGNHHESPREAAGNPYADFEELKRSTVAARDAAGYANTNDTQEAEENHYQDLDDVRLDIRTSEADPTPSLTPPAISPASLYDNPRSFPTAATATGNGATPTGNDAGNAQAFGYMHMEGQTPRTLELEMLDSSDEEEGEGAPHQEDIDWLRQEVQQRSTGARQSTA